MSPDAPLDLAEVRRAFLAARDARQARLDSFLSRAGDGGCVVVVSTVIPGVDKRPAGAELLVEAAWAMLQKPATQVHAAAQAALRVLQGSTETPTRAPTSADGTWSDATAIQAIEAVVTSSAFCLQREFGEDILGEFLLFTATTDPRRMKETCMAVESAAPWGRLLDLDVYDAGGQPVTRRALRLPERTCLVCDEPARDCVRLGRHGEAEVRARAVALLRAVAVSGTEDAGERDRTASHGAAGR